MVKTEKKWRPGHDDVGNTTSKETTAQLRQSAMRREDDGVARNVKVRVREKNS